MIWRSSSISRRFRGRPLRLHTQEHHHHIPIFLPNLKIIRSLGRLLREDDAKHGSVLLGFVFYSLATARPIDGSIF